MDYRKFLGQKKELLLPYFSGPFLHDGRGQRLRVERKAGQAPPAPGFYLCELKGSSVVLGAAQQPDLTAYPAVRGHFAFDLLTYSDGEVSMVQLLPADEPPRFSPLVTRRYENGALLFDSIEFESEAEEAARQAYEEQRGLGTTRGVASSLRAAFAYAIATRAAERLGIPVSPLELRPDIVDIAEHGPDAAHAALQRLVEERRAYAAQQHEAQRQAQAAEQEVQRQAQSERDRQRAVPAPPAPPTWQPRRNPTPAMQYPGRRAATQSPLARAEAALLAADAQLLDGRQLAGGQLEVTYRFRGQRFITIVNANTLQVIDAGVCLAGADSMVTLESLPSVLGEAIATRRLVITRHSPGQLRRGIDDWEDGDD